VLAMHPILADLGLVVEGGAIGMRMHFGAEGQKLGTRTKMGPVSSGRQLETCFVGSTGLEGEPASRRLRKGRQT